MENKLISTSFILMEVGWAAIIFCSFVILLITTIVYFNELGTQKRRISRSIVALLMGLLLIFGILSKFTFDERKMIEHIKEITGSEDVQRIKGQSKQNNFKIDGVKVDVIYSKLDLIKGKKISYILKGNKVLYKIKYD